MHEECSKRGFISNILGFFTTRPPGSLNCKLLYLDIDTYHSLFIPEGVEETSQIFLRDTPILPKLLSYIKYCRRDRW
jgi:hypothetical protein